MGRKRTRVQNPRRIAAVIAGTVAAVSFVFGGTVGPVAAASGPSSSFKVIASNLNNPRSLAWGPHSSLLVSEAGTGGKSCSGPTAQRTCIGITGSIASISHGKVSRFVKNLVSISVANQGVTGPDGLAYYRSHLYTVMTDSSAVVPTDLSPALADEAYSQLGRVLDVTPRHNWTAVADPGDYDYAWSNMHKNLAPTNFPDANPYALLVTQHGAYVVDAGTNTLDSVSSNGTVKILAFVPNPKVGDAVPTCVAQGGKGALYIGQLTAFGNGAGTANVYRWTAKGGLKVWRSGFSAITGCGFDTKGNFYVTEFDTTGFPPKGAPAGAVVQIAPNGTRKVLGAGKLFAPNGFLAGPNGAIYVTNWSVQPAKSVKGSPTGQVVEITP